MSIETALERIATALETIARDGASRAPAEAEGQLTLALDDAAGGVPATAANDEAVDAGAEDVTEAAEKAPAEEEAPMALEEFKLRAVEIANASGVEKPTHKLKTYLKGSGHALLAEVEPADRATFLGGIEEHFAEIAA